MDEDSSVLNSIFAKITGVQGRSHASSDASAWQLAWEKRRSVIKAMSWPSSGISFTSFNPFDKVWHGFEFSDKCPSFYPPSVVTCRAPHRRHKSTLRIMLVSSYGHTIVHLIHLTMVCPACEKASQTTTIISSTAITSESTTATSLLPGNDSDLLPITGQSFVHKILRHSCRSIIVLQTALCYNLSESRILPVTKAEIAQEAMLNVLETCSEDTILVYSICLIMVCPACEKVPQTITTISSTAITSESTTATSLLPGNDLDLLPITGQSFVHKILRRSCTSVIVLQTALCYNLSESRILPDTKAEIVQEAMLNVLETCWASLY